MDTDKRLESYKDRYKHEIDLREKLEARIKTPFAIMAIVFGLIAYLFRETVLSGNLDFDWFFWITYSAAILLFAQSFHYFFKAITGYRYKLIPTPEVLENYLEDTIEHYAKHSPSQAKAWANKAHSEYLFKCYVEYTSINTRNNDSKSYNINKCINTLIVAFLLSCNAYLPFYAGLLEQKESANVRPTTTTTTSATEGRKGPTSPGQTTKEQVTDNTNANHP